MKKREIVIIDDEPSAQARYSKKLKQGGASRTFEIRCASNTEILDGIAVLEGRCQKARTGRQTSIIRTIFDDAAVLVIDYDLIKLQGSLTGANIAYLARNYSSCGFIVGLNQFGDNSFDLELSGKVESFADLNVGGTQLSNPGLWSHSVKGFRPWHWPSIPDAVEALERRVLDVQRHLGAEILAYLGFPKNEIPLLPKSILSFLSGKQHPEKTTFRDFVLHSPFGLREKDRPWNDAAIARCAAARITKWLEFIVLPRQDILVDAPHLASRYPSLIKGARSSMQTWNRLAVFEEKPLLQVFNARPFVKAKFTATNWLYRPAWWWHGVSASKEIAEVKSPWDAKPSPFVFCEDVSRFVKKDQARPFTSSLDTPYASRYVEYQADVDYRPSARLAL